MSDDLRSRSARDEQRAADALARYLDALIAGDPTPPAVPPEIADLAPLARALTQLPFEPAPTKRHADVAAKIAAIRG